MLVAVLAVTGVIAGLVATMSFWARNSAEAVAVELLDAEDDALLQAGVEVVGLQLFVRRTPASALDGQRLALDAGTITVRIADDTGKIDLNGSSADLLAIAWRAAGLHGMSAETFASRVLDWRDADGKPNKNGAEEYDYRKAGLPGPRNGPFHSVSDLIWVLGVSGSDLSAIRPFVTVFNPSGKLNPIKTSGAMLSLLPDMTKGILEEALSIRKEPSKSEAMNRLHSLLDAQGSYLEFGPSNIFNVDLKVSSNHGQRRQNYHVVLMISNDPRWPYRVVNWSEG